MSTGKHVLIGALFVATLVTGTNAGWWAWQSAAAAATIAGSAYSTWQTARALRAITPPDSLAGKQPGILINQTGTEVSLPIVYGKARVGISRVDVRQGTDADVLALVGAIALAPEGGSATAQQGIEEITTVYFDGDAALSSPIFGANDSATNNPVPFNASVIESPWNGNVTTGTFGSDYWLEYFIHDGDDDQVVDRELNRIFGSTPWGTYARGVGLSYIVLWLYWDDDVWANGVPQVTMDLKGNKVASVLDSTADFRYSENPVDCVLDFMTSTRYGMGIPTAQMDWGQTVLQANPITTVSGSTVITVAHSAAHNALVGDRVILSKATAVGGITAARLNVQMTITEVPSATSFKATLGGANATSAATGGGSAVRLDTSTFGEAAYYCDEPVTITLTSGTRALTNRFTANGWLDSADTPQTNLDRLLSACSGRIVREGGKYKLLIRKVQAASSFELDRSNIVGEWSFAKGGVDEVANTQVVTFVDKDQNYQPVPLVFPRATTTNAFLAEDFAYGVEQRIDLPFTEDAHMAQMINAATFNESRADMSCSLVAQREALRLSVGDVVNVTHPTPGWTDQPMWVEAVALRRDGLVSLLLKEYLAATYTVPTMAVKSALVPTLLPPRYTSAAGPTVGITDLYATQTAVSNDGTNYLSRLDLQIEFTGGMGSYKIHHAPDGVTAYSYITNTTATSANVSLNTAGGSAYPFYWADGGTVTGQSIITITPYPNASAGGIAGTAQIINFQVQEGE